MRYRLIRVKPETHKELKILAANLDKSLLETIMFLIDFYKKNG